MMNLTAVSLFAGIGGFDLALTRAGVDVVAAVEIDDAARGVLADRFPDTTLFTDIREVTGDDLRAAGFVPDRGIITAGWPCQGNSVAGHRGGLADPRSGLWKHVVRLLDETAAAWFIGENVPGLLSVNGGEDFGVVLDDLAGLGMGFCWRVLDAQYFGVPQRRRRVFIVGCAGGDSRGPVEVLLEPEGRPGDSAARGETGESASGGSPVSTLQGGGKRGYRVDAEGAAGGHLIAASITAREGKGPDSDATTTLITAPIAQTLTAGNAASPGVRASGRRREDDKNLLAFDAAQITSRENRPNPKPGDPAMPLTATGYPHVAHTLTGEGHDASEDGTGRGTPLVPCVPRPVPSSLAVAGDFSAGEDIAQTVRAANGQPGTVAIPVALRGRAGGSALEAGECGDPAFTVRTAAGGSSHSMIATAAVRRLTPLECERLQGFPDLWTATSNGKPQADAARYRQCGNAVAVPVVEWIAGRLVAFASVVEPAEVA